MDFFDTVIVRHSVRSFTSQKVEAEKIQKILECTCRAPSAGNLQGYEIFVVTSETHRAQLVSAAYGQQFLGQAPIVLVFCADPSLSATRYHERGEKLYSLQDATIACTYAMLAATALGLSTVWVGSFDEEAVINIVGISETLKPIVLLPVGYAGKPPRITPRRSLNELVHYASSQMK